MKWLKISGGESPKNREKRHSSCVTKIRINAVVKSTMQAKKKWNDIYEAQNDRTFQSRSLHPLKDPLK